MTEADARRGRLTCYLAAAVFAACTLGLAFLPVEMAPAVRWVLTAFNGVIALAVWLYGRSLRADAG